jgi:hypothetical protein
VVEVEAADDEGDAGLKGVGIKTEADAHAHCGDCKRVDGKLT